MRLNSECNIGLWCAYIEVEHEYGTEISIGTILDGLDLPKSLNGEGVSTT